MNISYNGNLIGMWTNLKINNTEKCKELEGKLKVIYELNEKLKVEDNTLSNDKLELEKKLLKSKSRYEELKKASVDSRKDRQTTNKIKW